MLWTLNNRLIFKQVDINFNKKAWLKPYIDMNTELRKDSKNILKNTF